MEKPVRITDGAGGSMRGKSAEPNQIKLGKRDGGFFSWKIRLTSSADKFTQTRFPSEVHPHTFSCPHIDTQGKRTLAPTHKYFPIFILNRQRFQENEIFTETFKTSFPLANHSANCQLMKIYSVEVIDACVF